MKRTKNWLLGLMSVAFLSSIQVKAQTTWPAILPDVPYWGNGTHPNNATADYTLQTVTPWGGPYLVKVTAADNAGTGGSGTLFLDDNHGAMYSSTISLTPGLSNLYPDVAICDNLNWYTSMMTNSFLVPVVYNEGGTIFMNINVFFNAGGSAGAGSITYPHPIQVSATGVAIGAPHIDAVAMYSSVTPWGAPAMDHVTITWAEVGGDIRAWTGSINSLVGTGITPPPSLAGAGAYFTVATGGNFTDPDVAMVERMMPGGPHEIAMFACLENSLAAPVGMLEYFEWDFTTGTLIANYVQDVGLFDPPRIDAIDNYHYNDPTLPRAYYTTVTSGFPVGSSHALKEYNNLTGFGGSILSLGSATSATVACGPSLCGGSIASGQYGYTIQTYVPLFSNLYATQTDWNTGLSLSGDFYQVNMNAIPMVNWLPNAICSSNNEDGTIMGPQYAFSTWTDGSNNLWNKLNQMCPGFSFKPTTNTQPTNYTTKDEGNGVYSVKLANAVSGSDSWSATPNPAKDYFNLSTPQLLSPGDNQFTITDITGREMLRSNIASQNERVDVSKFAPGMYMLNVYQHGKSVKTMKVVKE